MKFIVIAFVATVFFACNGKDATYHGDNKNGSTTTQGPKENAKVTDSTTVEIIDTVYNFGKVKDGEKVSFNFRFKNSGTKPLVIYKAQAGCGCTVPEWPEKPIMPGETGFIKVVFNSKGKSGDVTKNVDVMSNAYPSFPELFLKGFVEAAQ